MRRKKAGGGCAVALALLTAAQTAWAQARLSDDRGLDLRLYRPPIDADGYLTVNGTEALRNGEVGFSAAFDLGWKLLPIEAFEPSAGTPGGVRRVGALVDSAATALATANVGLGNGGVFGVSLPLQSLLGPVAVVPGVYNDRAGLAPEPLRSNGLGDLEVHGKLSFLQARRNRFGLSALARLELPTGQSTEFRGEPGVTLWPSLALEYAPFAFIRAGAELGYRWISGDGARLPFSGGSVEYDDQFWFGAAVELKPTTRLALALDTYGTQIVRAFGEKEGTSIELAGGAKYQVDDYIGVLLGGAFGALRGIQGARARAFFALTFAPTSADFDGDGYSTHDDACPQDPEDFDGFEDSDGCPDLDNDRDGVPDATDQCLMDPEDWDRMDDFDGCPERPIPDSDGDGVDDYSDDSNASPEGNQS